MDERDVLIQSRAWAVAYAVFWVVFIGVCVSAPFTFGSSGAVPVELIQTSVWYGFMIVWGRRPSPPWHSTVGGPRMPPNKQSGPLTNQIRRMRFRAR